MRYEEGTLRNRNQTYAYARPLRTIIEKSTSKAAERPGGEKQT